MDQITAVSTPVCLCCVADSSHCWDVLDGVYAVICTYFWSWGSLFIPCAAVQGLGCCIASASCCFLPIYRFGSLLCQENMFKSIGMETNPKGTSDAPEIRVNTGGTSSMLLRCKRRCQLCCPICPALDHMWVSRGTA